eukprot:6172626-Pleurochrysis_carterae.AAC.1
MASVRMHEGAIVLMMLEAMYRTKTSEKKNWAEACYAYVETEDKTNNKRSTATKMVELIKFLKATAASKDAPSIYLNNRRASRGLGQRWPLRTKRPHLLHAQQQRDGLWQVGGDEEPRLSSRRVSAQVEDVVVPVEPAETLAWVVPLQRDPAHHIGRDAQCPRSTHTAPLLVRLVLHLRRTRDGTELRRGAVTDTLEALLS